MRKRSLLTLRDTIEWVRDAAAKTNERPVLTAVYMDSELVAATDSYRMRVVPWKDAAISPVLVYPDGRVVSNGVDGVCYPDIRRIIPASKPLVTQMLSSSNVSTIRQHASAVTAASRIARGWSVPRVTLAGNNTGMFVYARGGDVDTGISTLVRDDHTPWAAEFDARLLLKALGCGGVVMLDFWDSKSPVKLTTIGGAAFEFLMPLVS